MMSLSLQDTSVIINLLIAMEWSIFNNNKKKKKKKSEQLNHYIHWWPAYKSNIIYEIGCEGVQTHTLTHT